MDNSSLPSGILEHCRSLGILMCTRLRDGVLKIGPFSEMMNFEAFQLIFNGIQQLLSLRNLGVSGHGH
ncbi:hypothetical protein H5410_053308 [Solanum commersonii]|uniref:Uncharacterized protein n=1 Tax=Solanum commersonii TaxID=4109 RepID=A0A9J5X355_SOLCO|nr:hypothetical protein H5410_053308 [Solanum commersonii]